VTRELWLVATGECSRAMRAGAKVAPGDEKRIWKRPFLSRLEFCTAVRLLGLREILIAVSRLAAHKMAAGGGL